MTKPRKVIRSKSIYKTRKDHKKLVGTVLFLVLLAALVGIGFLVMREVRRHLDEPEPPNSSAPSTVSRPDTSAGEDSSSEPDSGAVVAVFPGQNMPLEQMRLTGEELNSYMQSLKSEGYASVIVTLKAEGGAVTYSTGIELGKNFIVDSPADLAVIVAAAKENGLTPVARISALKDGKAAHVKNENSFAYQNNTEVNWLDDSLERGGAAWLNPYMPKAREYISAFCSEAVSLGFEAIILQDVNFPLKNTSQMGTIDEFTTREKILQQLVAEAQAAAGDVPVYNQFNLAITAALSTEVQLPEIISQQGGKVLFPVLDLEQIAAYQELICQKAGITSAEGYDAAMTPQEVVRHLLEQFRERGDIVPAIPSKDLAALKPVFEELSWREYIVI